MTVKIADEQARLTLRLRYFHYSQDGGRVIWSTPVSTLKFSPADFERAVCFSIELRKLYLGLMVPIIFLSSLSCASMS